MSTYNKEVNDCLYRIEELSQELENESKIKDSFLQENSLLKSRLEEANHKLKFEVVSKEEERIRIFEGKKAEMQEIVKDHQKKDEDMNRLSQINLDMHRNVQLLKHEKEEYQKKIKELELKNRDFEEEKEKIRKKFEDLESKYNETKDRLQQKTNEINHIRMEQRTSLDASFRFEKENMIKYEEFHQVENLKNLY